LTAEYLELRDDPRCLGGAHLQPGDMATTVRGGGGDRLAPGQQEIDWHEVALLYERLEHLTASPVVTLNRAVAVAEAGMPERALELVDTLELGDYRYLPSTRAELLRRLGRSDEARAAFAHALRLATTDAERRFLARRLASLTASEPGRRLVGSEG
jgi:predicted RNA polymerase sigma factor